MRGRWRPLLSLLATLAVILLVPITLQLRRVSSTRPSPRHLEELEQLDVAPQYYVEQQKRRVALVKSAWEFASGKSADPRIVASGMGLTARAITIPPAAYYLFQPTWSCPDHERCAGVWVCGLRRLEAPCLIYAVSDRTHDFARQMQARTPCVVRTFGAAPGSQVRVSLGQPTDGETRRVRHAQASGYVGQSYQPGVIATYTMAPAGSEASWIATQNLSQLMRAHGDSELDLLHLDVAGHEWGVLASLEAAPRVRQVSAQLHFESFAVLTATFEHLAQVGYRDYASTLSNAAIQQHSWVHCASARCAGEGGPIAHGGHEERLAAVRLAAHREMVESKPSDGAVFELVHRANPLQPTWSCDAEEYVGYFGDGGKWVCAPRQLGLGGRSCVIYSLGGSQNTQFELEMARLTPCQVVTIDLNCFETCATGPCYPQALSPRLQCLRAAVSTRDAERMADADGIGFAGATGSMDPTRLPIRERTLQSLMRSLGHMAVDVLKIDIEVSLPLRTHSRCAPSWASARRARRARSRNARVRLWSRPLCLRAPVRCARVQGDEFRVLGPILKHDSGFPWATVSQVLIETHVGRYFHRNGDIKHTYRLLERFFELGFVLFHSEVNINEPTGVHELALVRPGALSDQA
jgi:hypothetical protein